MTGLVSAAEASVLTVARGALGISSVGELTRVLVSPGPVPRALGPTARELLHDTLARGLVLALARSGGWYGPTPVWAMPLPALHFGEATVQLLQWAVATPLGDGQVPPLTLSSPLTPAEECLLTVMLHRARGTQVEEALARQAPFRRSPLVLLAHAGVLARWHSLPDGAPSIDVAAHGPFIAGLRGLMADAWFTDEVTKRGLERPEVLHRVGDAQQQVLASFLAAAAPAVSTHALAGFLVDTALRWLAVPVAPDALDSATPMRARLEARRSAAAFLRGLATLGAWDTAHRATHFIDDDYAAAQAVVRDWARLGPSGFREAAKRVADLDALAT
ncbi:MAG: hypothetical protein JNG84_14085 [Archangium sp.]|nr:hypothetical protein [Archangium sp.]